MEIEKKINPNQMQGEPTKRLKSTSTN